MPFDWSTAKLIYEKKFKNDSGQNEVNRQYQDQNGQLMYESEVELTMYATPIDQYPVPTFANKIKVINTKS